MPCEQLVSYLCDIKQAYTQYGGKRPFGVSILYMGWDKHYGYQLYQSDPSGNYGGWKATCIGNNSGAAISILKQELSDEPITLAAAEDLAVKVLSKSLDMTKLTSEKGKLIVCACVLACVCLFWFNVELILILDLFCLFPVEMATLTRVNEKTIIKILTNAEVDVLIAKYEKIEAELEAAKREKLAQKS